MSDEYRISSTDDEILPFVDWEDRQIGIATRREIHLQGLLHRAVHVIIANDAGKIVLQRRCMEKDRYPGWWDISVGGHVGPDEVYVEAARRELSEEMGIDNAEPILAAIITPSVITGWEHVHLFGARIEGDVTPHASEISGIRWIDPKEILSTFSPESTDPDFRITPSGYNSIEKWFDVGAPGLKKNSQM